MNEPRPLRQRIAHAINRYDNHHALSGNDIPSKHHYGEADFVLAELRAELGLTDPEVRRQLAAVIRALGKSETALARVREYLGRHAHRVAVAPIDVLAVLNGSRDPAEEWAPDSPPIVGIVPPIDEPGPEATDTTQPEAAPARIDVNQYYEPDEDPTVIRAAFETGKTWTTARPEMDPVKLRERLERRHVEAVQMSGRIGDLKQELADERERADEAEETAHRIIDRWKDLANERYEWQERGLAAERHRDQLAAAINHAIAAVPPPLGTSMSRWWDARLTGLRAALEPPKEQ